ncbi:MAG: peptidoglycan DD-metalloendopeptidase family protein [Deltaproteobacteria bacterium]|nr:peptidoglycan DD-metalloendopeptidase family protein [Deltaproteobacteria bacterium]
MKRSALLALILPCLIFCAEGVSYAKRPDAKRSLLIKEKKLEDVRKQIREEKKSVKDISEKETSVLGDLEEINKKLVASRDELKKIEDRIRDVNARISRANGNISRLEREKKEIFEKLNGRLRAMYRMRRGESVKALFSFDSTSDLGRKHKYLTMIMDSDSSLIERYERNIKGLAGEKKGLDALAREMKSSMASVLAKKRETESIQRERVALLNDVKREKERRIKTIKELEQAAAGLSDLIDRLRAESREGHDVAPAPEDSSGFGAMKGRLIMPVEGRVVSFYGKVKHPRFQTVTFNNGIVIGASTGTPVKNVYDGKVVYVGWLKGYGQVMIVDHRGGYYTLFAYLSKSLKERGDMVKQGAEIALVGDTGPDSTQGLYFEIRQKGVPRDPMSWLAAR